MDIGIDGTVECNVDEVNECSVWGVSINDEFHECGDLLDELDAFLNKLGCSKTKIGSRIRISIGDK